MKMEESRLIFFSFWLNSSLLAFWINERPATEHLGFILLSVWLIVSLSPTVNNLFWKNSILITVDCDNWTKCQHFKQKMIAIDLLVYSLVVIIRHYLTSKRAFSTNHCIWLLLQLYLFRREIKVCIRYQNVSQKNWLFERWMWCSKSRFLFLSIRWSAFDSKMWTNIALRTYIEIRSVLNLIWQLNLSPYKRNKQGIKKSIRISPWINAFAVSSIDSRIKNLSFELPASHHRQKKNKLKSINYHNETVEFRLNKALKYNKTMCKFDTEL